jgi:glycosyltransferase involved in cell wall biosynthesis
VIGEFGGASRSLFETVRAFPPGEVEAVFVTARGSVLRFFSQLGRVISAWGVSKLDHTRYGYYRGMRWLILVREIAYLPATLRALRRARAVGTRVDIVHLNEFSGLPVLWLARRWLAPAATVVHVRSLANENSGLARTRWVHRELRRASAVVAIDQNVRSTLPADLRVDVIHNAFSPSTADHPDPAVELALTRLRPESFKVGFVGNLLRVKGIDELIAAAHLTVKRGIDVEFIVVGGDARTSRGPIAWILRQLGMQQDRSAQVEQEIARLDLGDRVHMLGFTASIARVYRCMDVLCFPSHYDAPGRPIFEAAFFGVPSIVAVREPRADTLVHGVTGLAFTPGSAEELADAIERLARNVQSGATHGSGGQGHGRGKLQCHAQCGTIAEGISPRAGTERLTGTPERIRGCIAKRSYPRRRSAGHREWQAYR